MRLSRLSLAGLSLVAVAACDDSDPSGPNRPPLAAVRVINAISDTSAVDVRMIDQVEWSIVANNINFRAGTEHQAIEAKARRIRVFSFANSADPTIDNVNKILHDTTITLTADSKVTLLLTGSARARTVRFVLIDDNPPAPASGQIAVRTVNASTGAIDAYYVASASDPIAGTPGAGNVAPLAASAYVVRSAGAVAARVAASGTATATASLAGPTAPTGPTGSLPAAGVNTSGSAFSIYYFPAGAAGSPQGNLTAPSIQWFVDRVPTT
jgi:hypothetical protein